MGHNASQATRRANALAAYLGDVRTWIIVSECQPCGRRTELSVGSLCDRLGSRMTILGVVGRLRCVGCRERPTSVSVGDRRHAVAVHGPGSLG